ncbi:hypothetical protein IC582_022714 [Cucumis melo]
MFYANSIQTFLSLLALFPFSPSKYIPPFLPLFTSFSTFPTLSLSL